MPSPLSTSHPSADAAPALDGLRRFALSGMHVAEDLLAILRASRAARSLLESPDAALAACGLDRPDAVPHAFGIFRPAAAAPGVTVTTRR